MNIRRLRRHSSRPGFTLLEVLLALSLSIGVLAIMSFAIRTNMLIAESGRSQIEQAQLARALVNRIGDDLRGAIYEQPVDMSGTEAAIKNGSAAKASQAAAALASAAEEAGAGGSGSSASAAKSAATKAASSSSASSAAAKASAGTSAGASSGSSAAAKTGTDGTATTDGKTSESSETSATTTTTSKPGVYGDASELRQIDVAVAIRPGGGALAPAGGMRTVSYYLSEAGENGNRRLMRREVDRAAAAWASSQGDSSSAGDGEVLADEVTALEFRYFDGTSWVEEWDSDASQALPMAVEIALSVAVSNSNPQRPTDPLALGATPEALTYRLIVQLPTSLPAAGTDAAATEGGMTEESSAAGGDTAAESSASNSSSSGSKSTGSKSSGSRSGGSASAPDGSEDAPLGTGRASGVRSGGSRGASSGSSRGGSRGGSGGGVRSLGGASGVPAGNGGPGGATIPR